MAMNNSVKIGLGFAAAWCVVKYVSYLIEPLPANIMPTVLINILFLLSAIVVALYQIKRSATENGNLLDDIKNGLKAGVPYAVVVSLFIYVYYTKINPEYNQHQIAETEVQIGKLINDPVEFKRLKESNPSFEVMTKEQLFKEMQKGPKGFYNANSTMTLSLLAMLLLSTLYSILVAIVLRRIVFRE